MLLKQYKMQFPILILFFVKFINFIFLIKIFLKLLFYFIINNYRFKQKKMLNLF